MSLPLDTARIRAEFPAFSEPALASQSFFDNAGGSYVAAASLRRLDQYLRATRVQPYGHYATSRTAGAAMDLAYERLAAALNVEADWLHFGPSTSANTYVLANAFGRLLPDDCAIVVTNQDHEANSGAWRRLAERGITVREWQVDRDTGHLDPAALDRLLDDKVRLIAFPHASNIVAEINPVAEIAEKARAVGAVAIVDGVSAAPHGLPDVAALGADIYLFSAYKTFGPHQGIMAVRPSLAAQLPNQGHFFNEGKPRYRLTPAGPDHAQIAASAGIADYLETVAKLAGRDVEGATAFRRAETAIRAQEEALLAPLLAFVAGRNDMRLLGPADPQRRAPTVSIAHKRSGPELARGLANHNIMAGGGHFYAWRLLEAMGVDPNFGVLRLSFLHYTSEADIARAIHALEAELC